MITKVQFPLRILSARRQAVRIALSLAAMLSVTAIVATPLAQAQTFTTLANISEGSLSGLVQDPAGNIYGTAGGGITGGVCPFSGCGTVFRLDTSGTVTVLYSFTGGADGEFPKGNMVLDKAGNLYGTTLSGGSGFGTVFRLEPSGTETVLYSFTGGADGSEPGGLVSDPAGNLYGTTFSGGITVGPYCPGDNGCGTVFKVDTSGRKTTLHSFTGQAGDGMSPMGNLALDAVGNLYGITLPNGPSGKIFKLDSSGTETVLYTSPGFSGEPNGGPAIDTTGNLYFTKSMSHDACARCGPVIKLDPSGTVTVVHYFTGPPDGFGPGELILDLAGNLYGTTFTGGTGSCTNGQPPAIVGCGTIFKVDKAGNETVLYSFTGQADGEFPAGNLVLDAASNIYGTSRDTVFKLSGPPGTFPLTVTLAGNGTGKVMSDIPGIDCPAICWALIATGATVNLTATADAGSTFSGWGGACSSAGTCMLTMNSATVATSTFSLLQDFALSATPFSPSTISPGSSSTSKVNVAAINSFSGAVALTCSVQPSPALAPTCSISPNPTTTGTPATITVRTTAPNSAATPRNVGPGLFFALCLALAGLVLTSVGFGSQQKRKIGNLAAVALGCLLFAGLLFQVSCAGSSVSGGGSGGTPSGTYAITITGTYSAGALAHSIPAAQLIVQ